jgi:hypothetical protein
MEDKDLREQIRKLLDEEHELLQQEAQGAVTNAQRERMREIEEYLDQCWNLLRYRNR